MVVFVKNDNFLAFPSWCSGQWGPFRRSGPAATAGGRRPGRRALAGPAARRPALFAVPLLSPLTAVTGDTCLGRLAVRFIRRGCPTHVVATTWMWHPCRWSLV